ncbi:hypothetical protein F5Y07DRAFT_364266 [Xylaria sp. FL0933]|nr:hypothetical protein F5Y07DRAFT_364266 [Xylaria sp. FL0933]
MKVSKRLAIRNLVILTPAEWAWGLPRAIMVSSMTTLSCAPKELRRELNNLVNEPQRCNRRRRRPSQRSQELVPMPVADRFAAAANHHWRSHEDVHELDKTRKDALVFLSAWIDYDTDTSAE